MGGALLSGPAPAPGPEPARTDNGPNPSGVAARSVAGELCLAVTSSTSVVGVAVGRAGAPADEMVWGQVSTDRRHAEELTPLVVRILAEAGTTLDAVSCFAVDVGPGRFTGLRVGLATVRTLALVQGCPVVALTSLEILAAAETERPLLAVIDARRGEVFQQLFGPPGPTGAPMVGRASDLATSTGPDRPVIAVGDGADRYPEWYGPILGPGREPSAAVMITLAGQRPAVAGHLVAPVYLRDPDVHINVKTRHTPR